MILIKFNCNYRAAINNEKTISVWVDADDQNIMVGYVATKIASAKCGGATLFGGKKLGSKA